MTDLWNRFASHYLAQGLDPKLITKDGIIDDAAFAAAPVKVLFVARESNDFDGRDMRELLRNGPRELFGHALARWSVGLTEGFPDFDSVNDHARMAAALRRVALINIKKATGTGTAKLDEIAHRAQVDRELLREQIFAIQPTLIVAAGTIDPLHFILSLCPAGSGGNVFTADELGCPVLRFRHPSRAPARRSYDQLREVAAAARPV